MDKIFPDFFIGGSQKCGTTSLALWLDQHPLLRCSDPKEPNFFSNRAQAELMGDFSSYYAAPRGDGELLFEATTSYMTDKVALENIRKELGSDIKFIFILKDPVKRAVSSYYHLLKHHAEKRDLEEVFANIPDDPAQIFDFESQEIKKALDNKTIDITRYRGKYDNYTWAYRYVSNGLFTQYIAQFVDVFGKDNVLCLNLSWFHSQPEVEFAKVTKFLGVPAFENIPETQSVYNKTKISSYLYCDAIRTSPTLLAGARFLQRVCRKIVRKDYFAVAPKPLSTQTEQKLRKVFKAEFDFLNTL